MPAKGRNIIVKKPQCASGSHGRIVTFANYFLLLSLRAGNTLPLGPLALIISKHYYGALSKTLEHMDIDRYYSVLYYLSGTEDCSQQQICNSLAIDKTAMVKVMNYLIRAGYVERQVNPVDRREHFVKLTAKGRRQTAHVVKAFGKLDAAAFKGVTRPEKEIFGRVAGKLLSNLRSQPANDLFFNYNKSKRARKANATSK